MSEFSEVLMDHFLAPRNTGVMEAPDVVGRVGTLGQGPFMVLFLRLKEGRITEAKFQTYGCGTTIACGSMLTEMVAEKNVEECLGLTSEQLADAIGGVPPDKLHSPILAIAALRDALKAYAPSVQPVS
jgi:NifU-like protein involved in Fe-S cluster formation